MAYDQQLADAQREAEHWKFVAAYLASCHAATLEGLPKSAPKSGRKRHVEICRKAAAYLRGTDAPKHYGHVSKAAIIESDIVRCERSSERHAQP